ncbi:MAG: phosphoribosylformylglycinamidine cyclo-ligase [Candidatus Cloacimonadota bacterium]|nr:MAG: phosphoribosylformylglycinamidine cyclo-ligase [Candidatus Cloacimonadota bacterium]
MNKKKSGLNIDIGNFCSKNAYSWAKKTFKNRYNKLGEPVVSVDGAFSNILNFGDVKIGISSDGIGTKIELAERTGIYDTLGYDLVAMVVDDLVANGFEPTNISNILDVDYLDYDIINDLMKGLHNACNFANIAITGGEIAELGSRVQGYGNRMHFNWCATAIGVLHHNLKHPIDGTEIKSGDIIITLKSRGFRSNGFSLIRQIMQEQFGENWHNIKYKNRPFGEILLTSSLIYSPLICKILDSGFILKGIAHITGGGIPDNLLRVLKPKGLGAILDNLFEPVDFMKKIQSIGNISDKEARKYWNIGNGMLIIAAESETEKILDIMDKSEYTAKIAGKVISEPVIEIRQIH